MEGSNSKDLIVSSKEDRDSIASSNKEEVSNKASGEVNSNNQVSSGEVNNSSNKVTANHSCLNLALLTQFALQQTKHMYWTVVKIPKKKTGCTYGELLIEWNQDSISTGVSNLTTREDI